MRIRNFFNKRKGEILTITPIAFWLFLFLVVPSLFILVISFLTRDENGGIKNILTIGNYTNLAQPIYFIILIKSIFIAIFTTMFCLIFGYPFAYFIVKMSKKWQSILLLLIMLPFWTNSLVRTYAWIILLGENGFINKLLLSLHIIKEPLSLLYNTGAVFVAMVYMMFPFMVLPLYSTIEKMDFNLLEAAQDLGANGVQRFLKITLPLTKGGIMSGCILVFVPTLGLFFIPDLMGGSKVMLISNLIKNQFLTGRNWPSGAAISIVLILIMLFILQIYKKLGGKAEDMEVF